jgi:hypothetical protein
MVEIGWFKRVSAIFLTLGAIAGTIGGYNAIVSARSPSDDEQFASNHCPTWDTFRDAVRSGEITLKVPIPDLPEGFRQGCLTSHIGAHTLNLFAYREGIEIEYSDVSGRIDDIIPPGRAIDSADLPDDRIHAIHIGFDGGAGYTDTIDKYQAWHDPYISDSGTVLFRYTWATLVPEPNELPPERAAQMLDRLAKLLEQTRSDYSEEAEARFAERQSDTAAERSCFGPIYRAKRRIREVSEVQVKRSRTEWIQADTYIGAPVDRPKHVSILIEGKQPEKVLGSAAILGTISQDVLGRCDDVGLLTVGVWGSGYFARSGWVNGEIRQFRCTDRSPGPGGGTLHWGEQYCGL